MKFKGKYKNNRFVPHKSNEGIYYRFIELTEQNQIDVVIEITKSTVTSLAQIGLFNCVIQEVVNQTGNTVLEITNQLDDIRIKLIHGKTFESRLKRFEDYDTLEMTLFIERAMIYLNEYYNLNLNIIESNGKAKVINEEH